jgi:hypothetical protein
VPRVLILLLLAATAACRGSSPRGDLDRASDATRLERLRRAGAPLTADRIAWRVSARRGVGAWAWADGRVEVSRALIDRLDDEELAAALAHELGHLLDGGHLPVARAELEGAAPLGLRGDGGTDAVEARADRLGSALLARRGIKCDTMARMLGDVAVALGGDAPMQRRAAVIASACTSTSPP